MNNTPDKNTNSYTDYNINGEIQTMNRADRSGAQTRQTVNRQQGQPAQVQRTAQQARPQNGQYQQARSVNQADPMPRTRQAAQQVQQRRPLNDEERRRLEAARMAAMQNGGRMTDEEIRRRRQEQQYLNAAQPGLNNQTGVNPQRRVQIQNPTGGYNDSAQNRRNTQTQGRRKKKKVRINAGAVIFILLIAGVIGVSAYQLSKNEENLIDKPEEGISSLDNVNEAEIIDDIGAETDDGAEVPAETAGSDTHETDPVVEEPNLTLYDTVTVSNGTLDEGDLILVNYEYAYADTDTVALANVYNQRQSGVKVSSTAISLTAETLTALDNMLFGLTADTGCDDLLINSGHRNTADQQRIYDGYVVSNGPEYAQAYVADAGYSEHHTGLACDLSFFTDDGYLIPIADHDSGWWLSANCAKYGFILRYPSEKVDITKIAYEAWHFRYVGIPHAYACTAFDYCLEEYIAALKNYTAETKILHIKPDGTAADAEVSALPVEGGGWLTYYVPAAEGENTDVKLLRGDTYADYEISGNNADGYIVTVTLP